jgi:hypothetical protein
VIIPLSTDGSRRANCWRSSLTVSETVSEGGGWTVVMTVMLAVTIRSGAVGKQLHRSPQLRCAGSSAALASISAT